MKKELIMGIIFGVVILLVFTSGYFQLTGKVSAQVGGPEFTGPTQEQISCMETCSGCTYGDATCFEQHSTRCGAECGVETSGPPEPADEGEACMQKCILVGCDEFDFTCQNSKMDSCEDECGMVTEPEAKNEEEQCIRDCVAKVDPSIICGSGTFEGEGETGNEVCQKCAESCVHLYAGPCLTDELWREKENECMVQGEHMEAAPIRGDSGQGWECTVDLECIDRSYEWGDNPGSGPDNWEEGHAPSEDNVYWGDYKSDLEISGSEGVLEIRNTNIKNIGKKVKVNINGGEGVSLEEKDEKLIVKNEEVEVEIDNNLDKLVISEKGNKREIKNINIEIEEGKPIYKYEEKERAKLLGIVPVSKDVEKKVDAEKMDVLEENGPWWEFLSVEEKEKILEK